MEFLGNATEKTIDEFLIKLDDELKIGPESIQGHSFDAGKISDIIKCSDEIAYKLFSEPVPFYFDELDQVYILDDEDNKYYLDSDDTSPSFTEMCDLIVKRLPDLPFDLECSGYASRQAESANLFKCLVINNIVEKYYDKDIKDILDGYDYSKMTDSKGTYAFTNLIQKIQEESGPIEKVILMCLTTKCVLSNLKKDMSYEEYLDQVTSDQLRVILRKEATLNYSFDKKFNEAETPKEKFEIGELLKIKRDELLKDASSNDVLLLAFRIQSLNLNSVPGRKMRLIRLEAGKFVESLIEKNIFLDIEGATDFRKKLIKRSARLYLVRMKQIRFKLLMAGERDASVLIPKS